MIVVFSALAAWILAVGITAWATRDALRRLSAAPAHLDAPFNLYPVTVLKPLKGAESGLRGNLETFFKLDYPKYEITFSVADRSDPAFAVISELLGEHPEAPARLIVGDTKLGPNPKVNNMARGYAEARYDWLLISDSNVRVPPDYLKRLVAQLEPGVGMLTSIVAGQDGELVGGNLEAALLNSFYARGMAAAFAVGRPVVMGKSMLFRKSTAERFGGIGVLARYLAEDYIAGEAIRHLGLRVALSVDPVDQHIGAYSFQTFWQRHLRWGRIRKAQAPLAFLLEPFLGCAVSGAVGAFAFARLGVPLSAFWGAHLAIRALCDLALMRRLGQKLEIALPGAWFFLQLLAVPMWAHTACGSTVLWRGRKLKLRAGGLLEAT